MYCCCLMHEGLILLTSAWDIAVESVMHTAVEWVHVLSDIQYTWLNPVLCKDEKKIFCSLYLIFFIDLLFDTYYSYWLFYWIFYLSLNKNRIRATKSLISKNLLSTWRNVLSFFFLNIDKSRFWKRFLERVSWKNSTCHQTSEFIKNPDQIRRFKSFDVPLCP